MERKDCVKMEDPLILGSTNSVLVDYYPALLMSNRSILTEEIGGWLDYSSVEKNRSLGFMELLNLEPVSRVPPALVAEPPIVPKLQLHELNAPATPNSSSISSECSGGQTSKEAAAVDGIKKDHKTKNDLKPKKSIGINGKKRQPRFAFMTKSQVDHLEDGYRWRKYGQKALKNSGFPRSYYKCTTASCNVKKRVERCFNDPTIVVTTYEGQHNHSTPLLLMTSCSSNFNPPPHYMPHLTISSNNNDLNLINSYGNYVMQGGSSSTNSAWMTDHGLLQDIIEPTCSSFNLTRNEH